MDTVNWIIFGFIISPPITFFIWLLVYSIQRELQYRKKYKAYRVEAMERLYKDCLTRLDRLQLEDKQDAGMG
jgi:TM2 domain-containing membrane protein YozV